MTDSDKKARNLRLLSQEGRLLANLSNDYIVRVFETVTTEDDAIIIMEYCEGGRLFDVLKTSKSYVSERTISHLMEQLLDAVAYLHSKNIIHRDIKIENILIESGSLNTGKIKLIDFGISVELREKCMLDKIVGTSAYMSPELVRGSYNEKIDEWACGIIMYILLSGVMPYKGRDSQEIRDIILVKRIDFSEPKLKGKSAECIQLLSGLMEREYTDRISAATALKSKWIVENQTCEIQSVDAFKLYDIEGIDPGDERLKALFEILMVRVFSDKIQDKVQVSDIFGKLDRKNRGEISFEDLVCAVIVKGIEEKKAAFYQLKFNIKSVEERKISMERAVFEDLLSKVAFDNDPKMKGILTGYINSRVTGSDELLQVENLVLNSFGINLQAFRNYIDSPYKFTREKFYCAQLELFS